MNGTMDPMATEVDQQVLAQQLLAQFKEHGIDFVGQDALLNRLTQNVLETALEAEMDEHLGYGKHDVSGRDYDVEIRRVICSTNAIESVNARYRRAIGARGHFPASRQP